MSEELGALPGSSSAADAATSKNAATKQAHTPGPWRVDGPPVEGRNPNMGLWDIESDGGNVANSCTVADARLIASAPEFLASARSLLEAWDARTTGAQQIITGKSDRELQRQATDALEGLRAAIAKANGGEA